jgi:hypothetical protein
MKHIKLEFLDCIHKIWTRVNYPRHLDFTISHNRTQQHVAGPYHFYISVNTIRPIFTLWGATHEGKYLSSSLERVPGGICCNK